MRCAAHTVNLAIKDVVKQTSCEADLKKVRLLVRKSKGIVFRPIFKMKSLPVPVLDCETRWGTTAMMVESVLRLVDIVPELQAVDPSFVVDEELIKFAEQFSTAFKPMVQLLKKLQYADLTVGDMFKYYWIDARSELIKIGDDNIFATHLIKALKERKVLLFTNKAFLAGLFMDPRFNFDKSPYLDRDQKQEAIVCKH